MKDRNNPQAEPRDGVPGDPMPGLSGRTGEMRLARRRWLTLAVGLPLLWLGLALGLWAVPAATGWVSGASELHAVAGGVGGEPGAAGRWQRWYAEHAPQPQNPQDSISWLCHATPFC